MSHVVRYYLRYCQSNEDCQGQSNQIDDRIISREVKKDISIDCSIATSKTKVAKDCKCHVEHKANADG